MAGEVPETCRLLNRRGEELSQPWKKFALSVLARPGAVLVGVTAISVVRGTVCRMGWGNPQPHCSYYRGPLKCVERRQMLKEGTSQRSTSHSTSLQHWRGMPMVIIFGSHTCVTSKRRGNGEWTFGDLSGLHSPQCDVFG